MPAEQRARARHLHQSASKVNRMLKLVRGEDVNKALNILHFSPTKASEFIEKTLRSAIANIMNPTDAKELYTDHLVPTQYYVDLDPTLKRLTDRPISRVDRQSKRNSH